jgi:hypothetical protein
MLSQVERPATQWSDADALRFAWRTLTGHLRFFAGIIVAGDLVFQGLNAAQKRFAAHGPAGLDAVTSIFSTCLGLFLAALYIRVALGFCDGRPPAFADAWLSLRSTVRLTLLSVSYGLAGFALVFAGIIALAVIYGVVRSIVFDRNLGLPLALGGGAGAGAFVVSWYLGLWMIDRQLGGHIVVDRGLWPRAAFRLSARLVRPVRWRLTRLASLLLAIQLGLGLIAALIAELPPNPRFHFPHIATGWPPAVNEVVVWFIGSLAVFVGWLLLLAMSFAYRNMPSDSPASS